jgi:lysozyme family protein
MSGKDLSRSTVDHDVSNTLYRINMYEGFNFTKQEPKSLIETTYLFWTSTRTMQTDGRDDTTGISVSGIKLQIDLICEQLQ